MRRRCVRRARGDDRAGALSAERDAPHARLGVVETVEHGREQRVEVEPDVVHQPDRGRGEANEAALAVVRIRRRREVLRATTTRHPARARVTRLFDAGHSTRPASVPTHSEDGRKTASRSPSSPSSPSPLAPRSVRCHTRHAWSMGAVAGTAAALPRDTRLPKHRNHRADTIRVTILLQRLDERLDLERGVLALVIASVAERAQDSRRQWRLRRRGGLVATIHGVARVGKQVGDLK